MPSVFRGVYAIPPTPFHPDGAVDEASLRSLVRFCIDAGAHGITYPVNASEFTSLTDSERNRALRIVIEEGQNAIPIVAGVAGVSSEHAVALSQYARDIGATALIALPPYVNKARTEHELLQYYQAIDAVASGLPVFIQNHLPPVGTAMTPSTIRRIVERTETVMYVKEESWPAGHLMTELLSEPGSKIRGVFGGMAGRHLLDEYARGASGTMPACELCDLHVTLWNHLDAGRQELARDLFIRMLPLLSVETLYSVPVYKEVLFRRGIIASPRVRQPGQVALDAYDHQYLDIILEALQDAFLI